MRGGFTYLVAVLIWVGLAYLGQWLAKRKGRNRVGWAIGGVLFWPTLIILAVLPSRTGTDAYFTGTPAAGSVLPPGTARPWTPMGPADSQSEQERRDHVFNLGRTVDYRLIPEIQKFLRDESVEVRRAAVSSLEQQWPTGDAMGIIALSESLQDPDPEVRSAAALALGEFIPRAQTDFAVNAGGGAINELLRLITAEQNDDVLDSAFVTIGNVATMSLVPTIADLSGRITPHTARIGETAIAKLNSTPIRSQILTIMRQIQAAAAQNAPAQQAPPPVQSSTPRVSFEIADPDKAQKAVALAEHYIQGGHPVDPVMRALGVDGGTKPDYTVAANGVQRQSSPTVDTKIVSVATCLPSASVSSDDTGQIARLALQAIEHYTSLPKVQAFLMLPYRLQTGVVAESSVVPPEEQCRVYAGVENLLLEIYAELPQGGAITDQAVEQKVDRLIQSIQ